MDWIFPRYLGFIGNPESPSWYRYNFRTALCLVMVHCLARRSDPLDRRDHQGFPGSEVGIPDHIRTGKKILSEPFVSAIRILPNWSYHARQQRPQRGLAEPQRTQDAVSASL